VIFVPLVAEPLLSFPFATSAPFCGQSSSCLPSSSAFVVLFSSHGLRAKPALEFLGLLWINGLYLGELYALA
jgi:hypothetical protein